MLMERAIEPHEESYRMALEAGITRWCGSDSSGEMVEEMER